MSTALRVMSSSSTGVGVLPEQPVGMTTRAVSFDPMVLQTAVNTAVTAIVVAA